MIKLKPIINETINEKISLILDDMKKNHQQTKIKVDKFIKLMAII